MLKLRVVHSCHAEWTTLPGEGSSRHCDACDRDVRDLASMSEADARAHFRASPAACVRMRLDGLGGPLVAGAIAVAVFGCTPPPREPPRAAGTAMNDDDAALHARAAEEDARDDDHDGIANPADACPETPGEPDIDPHHSGCPREFVGLVISPTTIQILATVSFANARATPLAENEDTLEEIAKALAENPQLAVEVEGHAADDEGHAVKALSEARARAVIDRLVAKKIDRARLTARGYGDARPIGSNTTADGRAKNRRVSFRAIDAAP